MTFKHMHNEIRSERLLLVTLEPQDTSPWGGPYRHINATVIRRAVPHMVNDLNQQVLVYNDGPKETTGGYRIASYVLTKLAGLYVDNMRLRGQIDVGYNEPLNEGRPYGNKIDFNPHTVDKNIARGILNFYSKYDMFHDKHGLSRSDSNFYVVLNHLAQFLKITKVVIIRPEYANHRASLDNTSAYEEIDIALCEPRILQMLAPFHKPKAQA